MILRVTTDLNTDHYDYVINIFGDSHTLCFGGCIEPISVEYQNKTFLIIQSGRDSVSITGILKPQSTLNYNRKIKESVANNSKFYYVFKMGQVDVEYIYYYKKYVKGESLSKTEFYQQLIHNYIDFIEQFDNNHIMVCGINLCGFQETESCLKYLRWIVDRQIQPENYTLDVKHLDHLQFNHLLYDQCRAHNIPYFDLTSECSNIVNGQIKVKNVFINPKGDHHYYGCQLVRSYADNYHDHMNDIRFKQTYQVFNQKLLDCVLKIADSV